MKPNNDSWETPQWLFDQLNKEFNFEVDLCATRSNSKTTYYYYDYLKEFHNVDLYTRMGDWNCAFMNPPYSNPLPFIEKAWNDSQWCKIVCLVRCDPSTKWWGIFWDYKTNTPKPGASIRFFPKRIKFVAPKGFKGTVTGPKFSSALIILDRRNVAFNEAVFKAVPLRISKDYSLRV